MEFLQPNLEDNKQLNEKGGSIKKSLDIQAVESFLANIIVFLKIYLIRNHQLVIKQVNEQPSSTSQLASMLDQISLDMNTNTKKIKDNQPVNQASTNAAIPNTKPTTFPLPKAR